MAFKQLIINHSKPATRCEICHHDDLFDPITEKCLRCAEVEVPAPIKAARVENKLPFQEIMIKAISFLLMTMGFSIFAAIISGFIGAFPFTLIFFSISFITGIAFILLSVIFTLYMLYWLVASIINKIYINLRQDTNHQP